MYKWVDEDGKIHLSNTKPANQQEESEKIWSHLITFLGREREKISKVFHFPDRDMKIVWEVERESEDLKWLDLKIEQTDKELSNAKKEKKETETALKKIRNQIELEQMKYSAQIRIGGGENEKKKIEKLRDRQKDLENDLLDLERKIVAFDKKIYELEKGEKKIPFSVELIEGSSNYGTEILKTYKRKGANITNRVEEGDYLLKVETDADCKWEIEILTKKDSESPVLSSLTQTDSEKKIVLPSEANSETNMEGSYDSSANSLLLQNPIASVSRSKAKSDLKESLVREYANHYSTIKMLLDKGMDSYDWLCKVPGNSVNNGILSDLKKGYYPHFSTIKMLFESNKKAYQELR